MKPQKIDIAAHGHKYLKSDDVCYFFYLYHAGQGLDYSNEGNSIISNIKKSPMLKDEPAYYYKQRDIGKCANLLAESISQDGFFIPVPPSYPEGSQDYDDRLIQILKVAQQKNAYIQYGDIAGIRDHIGTYHQKSTLRRPEEVLKNMYLKLAPPKGFKFGIVFDDVITTGAHFKALKQLIEPYFQTVLGIFITRTHNPPNK